jgi:hypothetical protein
MSRGAGAFCRIQFEIVRGYPGVVWFIDDGFGPKGNGFFEKDTLRYVFEVGTGTW